MIKCQQDVILIFIKAAFERLVCKLVDMILQFSASSDILGWDTNGILLGDKGVHWFTSVPRDAPRLAPSEGSRPSQAMPLEEIPMVGRNRDPL